MIAIIFIFIAFIHWLADFVLQAPSWKVGKSTSIADLTAHVACYSVIWLVLPVLTGNMNLLWFPFITFVCHWITDYFTSKFNKRSWDTGKTNLFFNGIGFDQFLHYAQLFLTYALLA